MVIMERLAESGQSGMTYVCNKTGLKKTFFTKVAYNPMAAFSYKDEEMSEKFKAFVVSSGRDYLIGRTAGEIMQSFRSELKELAEQGWIDDAGVHHDGLPPEYDEFVRVGEECKLNMRTGGKARGKKRTGSGS